MATEMEIGESEDTQLVFEELSYEVRSQEVENFNHIKRFKEGGWIDAQDTVGAWCVARITKIDLYYLHVHFDGWTHKYDEVNYHLVNIYIINIYIYIYLYIY